MKLTLILFGVCLFAACHQGDSTVVLSTRFWHSVHSLVDHHLMQTVYDAGEAGRRVISMYFNGGRGGRLPLRLSGKWDIAADLINTKMVGCRRRFHLSIDQIWHTVQQEHANLHAITLRMPDTYAPSQMASWDLVDNILASVGEYFKALPISVVAYTHDNNNRPIAVEGPTTTTTMTPMSSGNLTMAVPQDVRYYPGLPSADRWQERMARDIHRVIRRNTNRVETYLRELVAVMHVAARSSDKLITRHPDWPLDVKHRAISRIFDAVFEHRSTQISHMLRGN